MATITPPPKVLLFDVFGTCVDWRSTVVNELMTQAHIALNSATASLASSLRLRATEMSLEEWGVFAQQWRDSYMTFTRSLAADPSIPWKSVDQHFLDALKQLLLDWKIDGLWTAEEVQSLSLVWHRLQPWADSAEGITLLNQVATTCTLSNGNLDLLEDLKSFGSLPFINVLSAEQFNTYKPSPRVYLGAVEKMGIIPNECAMVAAHLNDLQAARANGLRTIYVERPGEEAWTPEETQRAEQEGWVDMWVSGKGDTKGFMTVAERLGSKLDKVGM